MWFKHDECFLRIHSLYILCIIYNMQITYICVYTLYINSEDSICHFALIKCNCIDKQHLRRHFVTIIMMIIVAITYTNYSY